MFRDTGSRRLRIAKTTINSTAMPIVNNVPVNKAANGKIDKPSPPSIDPTRKTENTHTLFNGVIQIILNAPPSMYCCCSRFFLLLEGVMWFWIFANESLTLLKKTKKGHTCEILLHCYRMRTSVNLTIYTHIWARPEYSPILFCTQLKLMTVAKWKRKNLGKYRPKFLSAFLFARWYWCFTITQREREQTAQKSSRKRTIEHIIWYSRGLNLLHITQKCAESRLQHFN